MSVREAIFDMASFLKVAPPAWRTPKMTETSNEILRRAAMMRAPIPEANFELLHQKFLAALESNEWSNIDALDWGDITYTLWNKSPNLLTINKFQINYRRFLEASKTARPFKRLLFAYLQAYDPNLEGIEWAGSLIRKILLQKKYLILEYWRKMELELQLFSISPGPRLFSLRCLEHPDSVYELHRELGLIGVLSDGGYSRHAYLHAVQILASEKFDSNQDLIRLQRFLEWTVGDHDGPFLRFPDYRAETFQLLLPTKTPPRAACKLLAEFFTCYAEAWHRGDPTCPEPSAEQIRIMGGILTTAMR